MDIFYSIRQAIIKAEVEAIRQFSIEIENDLRRIADFSYLYNGNLKGDIYLRDGLFRINFHASIRPTVQDLRDKFEDYQHPTIIYIENVKTVEGEWLMVRLTNGGGDHHFNESVTVRSESSLAVARAINHYLESNSL